LLDGRLMAAAATPAEALVAALDEAAPGKGALVTLYYGADVGAEEAGAAAAGITARFPGVEAEVIDGGQPHYHYLVSIE
ncbi:MAG: DAK2 domain-containing protein, partial [Chloroflexi bacterium]|nr:DAK2 domain-containing protein [Chloroflexota bacterium]